MRLHGTSRYGGISRVFRNSPGYAAFIPCGRGTTSRSGTMRHTLLISVAAIALTAASFASAQTQNRGPAGPSAAPAAPTQAAPSAPSTNAGPSQGGATENVSPADNQKGTKGAKGAQDQSGP